MTKIVVLDAYALNPGDLDWDPFNELGELEVYPRSSVDQIPERAAGADIILLNKAVLNAEMLQELDSLKFVSVMATGVNTVDLQTSSQMGVIVSNVKDYSTLSVAQHTLALILELTNRVGHHSRETGRGAWSKANDWSYWDYPLIELNNKTLGIIGLGNIGQQVASLGKAFGMKVITTERSARNFESPDNYHMLPLDEVFQRSDMLSLHCPLTPDTRHMVNLQRLKQMKPSAYLINTSRGRLIEESDLLKALDQEIIAGAALDVLSNEPPDKNNPLMAHPRCIVTPHQAWATYESRSRLMAETIENVKAFLEGNPRNVVDYRMID